MEHLWPCDVPPGAVKHYRRGDEALLLQGDSIGLLPHLKAHHVIGDPPYEEVTHKAFRKGRLKLHTNDGKRRRDDGLGFDGIDLVRDEVAQLVTDCSEGWVLLFSLAEGVRAWRDPLQAAGLKWDTTCFWIKPDAMPRMNGQGPARGAECFVLGWAGRGYRRWNGGGKRGVYTHPVNGPGRHGAHPTEKPLGLMRELIGDFTQPGDVVLDPFMGSGTTGVAAMQMGRRFIGIERDPQWFELACDRVAAVLPFQLAACADDPVRPPPDEPQPQQMMLGDDWAPARKPKPPKAEKVGTPGG